MSSINQKARPPMASRITTTAGLIRRNDYALIRGYDRTLPPTLLANLDPSGLHVVSDVLYHEQAGGVKVTPHLRCKVLVKVCGTDEPEAAFLDVSFDSFDSLPTARQVLDLVDDPSPQVEAAKRLTP